MKEQSTINRREFLTGVAALGSLGMTLELAVPAIGKQSKKNLPSRDEFVIRNAYVMTMDSAIGDLANGDVYVRNGEIIAVGTSTLRREFGYRLLTLQGFALISPLEGFSHGAVEVIDEFKNAGFQLNFATEIGTSK